MSPKARLKQNLRRAKTRAIFTYEEKIQILAEFEEECIGLHEDDKKGRGKVIQFLREKWARKTRAPFLRRGKQLKRRSLYNWIQQEKRNTLSRIGNHYLTPKYIERLKSLIEDRENTPNPVTKKEFPQLVMQVKQEQLQAQDRNDTAVKPPDTRTLKKLMKLAGLNTNMFPSFEISALCL